MLLQFDPNSLTLQVKVGLLEQYSPSPEVTQLHDRTEKLKQLIKEFKANVLDAEIADISKTVEELNKPYLK